MILTAHFSTHNTNGWTRGARYARKNVSVHVFRKRRRLPGAKRRGRVPKPAPRSKRQKNTAVPRRVRRFLAVSNRRHQEKGENHEKMKCKQKEGPAGKTKTPAVRRTLKATANASSSRSLFPSYAYEISCRVWARRYPTVQRQIHPNNGSPVALRHSASYLAIYYK